MRELNVVVLAGDALVREVHRELGPTAEPMLQGFIPTPGHSLHSRRETIYVRALARVASS